MQLGAKIRMLRRERGLTLQEVADQVGLSAGYLSQVENGRYENLPLEKLRELADVLGVVTLPELVSGVEVGAESTTYPADLQAFLDEQERAGQPVEAGLLTLLRVARSLKPGLAPLTVEEWRKLYYGLLAVVT